MEQNFSKEFFKVLKDTNFNNLTRTEIDIFDQKYDRDLEKALELNADERETLSVREWKEALNTIKYYLLQ